MVGLMSVFVLAAAFAADIGRVYAVKAQLQTAADAAALAAIKVQADGLGSAAAVEGINYVTFHPVMGRSNIAAADAVDSVGSWTMATSTWTPDPDQNWNTGTNATTGEMRDAVKVVIHHDVPFTFGKLLGWGSHTVTAEAIAIWGTANASTCVRPWAIPYQKMIDQLWLTRDPLTKPTDITTYSLTQQDMADLSTWTYGNHPVTLTINDNADDPYTGPNEFYAIKIPAAYLADGTANPVNNGGADYRSEIAAQSCAALAALYPSNTDPTIHIGDYLTAENGKMLGPTQQGITGQGQTLGICGTVNTCDPPVKIIAALWDSYGAAPGVTTGVCSNAASQGCYHVKYLAEFTLVGWDQPTKTVRGYFNLTTLPAGGASGFTAGGTGTLLFKALVK
jgi:Flp pilus assembly protein TadG